jgi:hypothetical protein
MAPDACSCCSPYADRVVGLRPSVPRIACRATRSFLRHAQRRSDWLDSIKFVPLEPEHEADLDWRLSLP